MSASARPSPGSPPRGPSVGWATDGSFPIPIPPHARHTREREPESVLDDEAGRPLPARSAPAGVAHGHPAHFDRPDSASSPRRPSTSLYAPTPSGAYFHVPTRARDELTRAMRSGTASSPEMSALTSAS